jgi:hypothetical protein
MTGRLNKKVFIYNIAAYILFAIASTIYWAKYYTIYTRYKGDEFIFFAEYLAGLTIIFYLVQLFFTAEKKYYAILFTPFLTIFTSLILGLGVLCVVSMSGTASRMIYVYGFVYSLTNILFSVFIFARYRMTRQDAKR